MCDSTSPFSRKANDFLEVQSLLKNNYVTNQSKCPSSSYEYLFCTPHSSLRCLLELYAERNGEDWTPDAGLRLFESYLINLVTTLLETSSRLRTNEETTLCERDPRPGVSVRYLPPVSLGILPTYLHKSLLTLIIDHRSATRVQHELVSEKYTPQPKRNQARRTLSWQS